MFFTETFDSFDHVTHPRRVQVASHIADAIRGLRTPKIVIEERLLLEFASSANVLILILDVLRYRLIEDCVNVNSHSP